MPLQGANPTPSFGGFGLKELFLVGLRDSMGAVINAQYVEGAA